MNENKIGKRLELPDGSAIVLIDRLGEADSSPHAERESNILRVDRMGRTIWRISAGAAVYLGSPFTGMGFDKNGRLVAYRWDGGEYEVNLDTGEAKPTQLTR